MDSGPLPESTTIEKETIILTGTIINTYTVPAK